MVESNPTTTTKEGDETTRLDEYDKSEWRDVSRLMRPDWTEEQFEEAWTEFQEAKRKRAAQ